MDEFLHFVFNTPEGMVCWIVAWLLILGAFVGAMK